MKKKRKSPTDVKTPNQPFTEGHHLGQRKEDGGPQRVSLQRRFHIWARENWYRDVWMFVLSIIVVITVLNSANASNQAKDTAIKVQQDRSATILRTCREQNARHQGTVAKLTKLENTSTKSGVDQLVHLFSAAGINITSTQKKALAAFEIAQIPQSIKQTKQLINQLQPLQDCQKVLRLSQTTKQR